jgi:hypothetical protein
MLPLLPTRHVMFNCGKMTPQELPVGPPRRWAFDRGLEGGRLDIGAGEPVCAGHHDFVLSRSPRRCLQ